MLQILFVLGVALLLAYFSQNGTFSVTLSNKTKIDVPLIALICLLGFFSGLRTNYNDTGLYIRLFKSADTLQNYLDTNPGIFENPLFYGFRNFFRNEISDNHHLYLVIFGFFTNGSMIRFIKKYSSNFVLSILIYFSIGLFYDTMGALKQTVAIAVLTYAIDALLKKKYLLYYIIVLIAVLCHSYAIFFIILPLFLNRPWTIITYVSIVAIVFMLMSFGSTLSYIMSAAEDTGKHLAEEELLDNIGINPFRLAVFAVPPILSFLFQNQLEPTYDQKKSLFVNMAIISFLIMALGIFTAANLFGRAAGYFEIGAIIILPWILEEIFDKKSVQMVNFIVGICYLGFFMYLSSGFSAAYRAIGIGEFFISLFN